MATKPNKFEGSEEIVTPVGVARYPKLRKPDTKWKAEGTYSVDLVLGGAAAQGLKAQANAVAKKAYDDAKKAEKNPAKRNKIKLIEPSIVEEFGDDEQPTGNLIFKFKRAASGKRKDGSEWTFPVPVFDKKGVPLPDDMDVWGGSKVQVSAELRPYCNPKGEAGVSLRLNAVMVIENTYGKGGKSASGYGFNVDPDGDDPTDGEADGTEDQEGVEDGEASEGTSAEDF